MITRRARTATLLATPTVASAQQPSTLEKIRKSGILRIGAVNAFTSLAKSPSLGHLIVPEPIFASQTAAITAKSATHDWQNHVNEWIDSRRKTGWTRARLIENLEKIGAHGQDIPRQRLF